MAEEQEKLLANFELRMRQLMFLCDSLKEQNQNLKEELNKKNSEITFLNSEIEQLKTQYSNLKFAKSFSSGNKNEINAAKQRLTKLVRDVDKCIALLKT